jgi:hypothetical protein
MLALAIIVAVGGYITIGFAYWAMGKAVPASTKEAVNGAVQQLQALRQDAQATGADFRRASMALIASPRDAETQAALDAATQVHTAAAQNLATATGGLKETLEGIGGVFKSLGSLSPPVAALCVAVLMFLTAGGIEVADRLIK